jgi:hypothetical protein
LFKEGRRERLIFKMIASDLLWRKEHHMPASSL